MIDVGEYVLKLVVPVLETLAPVIPGEIFPYFFTMEMLQRSLIAALIVTLVSGFLGMAGGILLLNSVDTGLYDYFITIPWVNFSLAITATIVLIIFGVIAGYIPAKRAAQIKPIVALRDE